MGTTKNYVFIRCADVLLFKADFTAGRDEYYPIPQREIDFTGKVYAQNPGY